MGAPMLESRRPNVAEATSPEVDLLPHEAKERMTRLTQSAQRLTWLSLAALWVPIVFAYTTFASIQCLIECKRLILEFPMILDAERAAKARPRASAGAPRNVALDTLRGFPQVRAAFWIIPLIPCLYAGAIVGAILLVFR